MQYKGEIAKRVIMVLLTWCWISFMVMVLWNALIPELFKGPVLTYYKAAGLLLLCRLLAGRLHLGIFDRYHRKGGDGLSNEDYKPESFKEKWARRCALPDKKEVNIKDN